MRAALLILLLTTIPVAASPEADARAALALAAAQLEQVAAPPARLTYAEATTEVRRTGKTLITWVGGADCPPCRAALTDCVHVHVTNLEGDHAPRCVVGIVDARGVVMCCGDLRGPWSAAAIRERIEYTRRAVQTANVPQMAAPTYTAPSIPAFAAPAQMRGGSRSC